MKAFLSASPELAPIWSLSTPFRCSSIGISPAITEHSLKFSTIRFDCSLSRRLSFPFHNFSAAFTAGLSLYPCIVHSCPRIVASVDFWALSFQLWYSVAAYSWALKK
eukprot:RCo004428